MPPDVLNYNVRGIQARLKPGMNPQSSRCSHARYRLCKLITDEWTVRIGSFPS